MPAFYNKGVNKIKHKKLKNILSSDFANTVVDYGWARAYDKLG